MCDTIVADKSVTKDGSVIFAKNSDRQPNEPHMILHVPATDHSDEMVKCTYIEIPQVDHSYEVLLSKPNWIWGAEIGANEHGLTIGNEAVYTNVGDNKVRRLIGMDFLRLALERAKTANEAIDVIADLLTEHGQGGDCGFEDPDFYDNSFIIADPEEAWVLETAGEYWIAEKVRGIRTISNMVTIESNYDRIHPEMMDFAIETGRTKDEDDFNFRQQFKTFFMDWAARGAYRRACTREILEEDTGKITPETAMRALRSHNSDTKSFNPRKSSMKMPCVHASSLLTPAQTTGSMVSHIKSSDDHIHWMTGTSAPCLSLFKPFITGQEQYEFGEPPNTFDNDFLWWRHEKLHRKTLMDYDNLTPLFVPQFRAKERELFDKIYTSDYDLAISKEEIFDLSEITIQTNWSMIDDSLEKVNEFLENNDPEISLLDRRYVRRWRKLSEDAGLETPLIH